MDVAFRVLGRGDAGVLSRVVEGVFDRPVVPERARALLADPAHVLTVAVEGGRVVGAILSVVYLRVDKPTELWINEVGVADAWQRRGIGRGLMKLTLEEAWRRGCAEAWVASDRGETALGFYRALGGAEEGGHIHFAWALGGH